MIDKILLDHYYRYPLMRAQDFQKLLFQGEFGGSHAAKQKIDEIVARISDEMQKTEYNGEPLSEIISSTQTRVNLAAFANKSLNVITLTEIFLRSATETQGAEENFRQKLSAFEQLVFDKKIGLPYLSTRSADIKYLNNIQPISHSATYKLNYNPHYRVVKRDYFDLFGVIDKINSLSEKDTITIAIEGNSGSGKSYYANVLENYYKPRCNVFHVDDFFLPLDMRTPERLAEVGGNVHYERVLGLINDIKATKPISYKKYDCHTNTYSNATAPARQINVIEGVYSAREGLADKYDIIVRLNVNFLTQQSRILSRSGAKVTDMYNRIWLPLENKYFEALSLPQAINICTDNNDIYSK